MTRTVALAVLIPALGALAALANVATSATSSATPSRPAEAAAPPSSPAAAPATAAATVVAAHVPLPDFAQPTVEPPVPRPATTPCVVPVVFSASPDSIGYTPPVDCPRPWSKVVLQARVSGQRSAAFGRVWLRFMGERGSAKLFVGAPQIHDDAAVWNIERDLTDYAVIFTRPGSIDFTDVNDAVSYLDAELDYAIDGRLLFYPANSKHRAPRVADVVREVDYGEVTLPRNVFRAFVDVVRHPVSSNARPHRFWYACLPGAATSAYPALLSMLAIGDTLGGVFRSPDQGCDGGSFRYVEVSIDGEPVGLAPVFPWLPSRLHRNVPDTLDRPAPSVQALNMLPYRVDLTPFAARLNDGLPHRIEVRVRGRETPGPEFGTATLLLYLDHGRAVVPGAVTANTFDDPIIPTVVSTLAPSGDRLLGEVRTGFAGTRIARGYVDTSFGRVHSLVEQRFEFANRQQVDVDGLVYPGLRGYAQTIALTNTMERRGLRWQAGGRVISAEREQRHYPLQLAYAARGEVEVGDEGDHIDIQAFDVKVEQQRVQRGQYLQSGRAYAQIVRERFLGERHRTGSTDSLWNSRRDYRFFDSAGSCYTGTLHTANGALTGRVLGAGCPGGVNRVQWYARVVGAPVSMGWAVPLP